MNPLPAGTVTFLFTDIEGSTKLLQQLGEQYAQVLSAHHEILRAGFENNHGRIVDTQGDSFFVAFGRAMDAVNAAVQAQRALAAHNWGDGIHVRVRMGLHTGEPLAQGERYVGIDVHRAARIGAAGHGGQILLSETTCALIQNELPRDVRVRALGKQRLKDFDAPASLYQIVCADLPVDFPPLKTLDARPNNLPAQLSSFIGRETEVAELERAMQATRLVTLIGAGGAGKTRLSIRLGEKMLGAFPDGVWFIELARLNDPALIPRTIATTLGLRDEAGNLAQTLKNYLEPKALLLVFDNCEHLIDAAAQWAETLLQAAPQLKIIASSREGLNIAGEQVFHVPSLSVPEGERALTPDALTQSAAARLFIERATAANDLFRVTAQNANAIAQICRRLDGIPLALELAAARVKALSVEQIAARLDDVFRLLSGGSRTAMPRQQTLAAAMDWSYNLLSKSERALLQRLSVFAGGWTLGAAEQICSGDEIAPDNVLDLLTQLVNKSLVIADYAADGTTRYRFLETLRQFARYRLYEAEAVEITSDRHLDYFVVFAERAQGELRGPKQIEWLGHLDTEHDNLRAALTWAISDNPTRAAQALRLTGALWLYWDIRGYFQEGIQWCERALAASDAENSARVETMFGAAMVARLGDLERTLAVGKELVALARKVGNARGVAEGLLGLGIIAFYTGDHARADAWLDEALQLWNALDDAWGIAHAQGPFAQRAAMQGDYARAAELYEKSLLLFRRTGDLREIAGALTNLASVVRGQGDLPRARAYAQEALELYSALADKHGIATAQRELGRVAHAQGDMLFAQQALEASRALFQEMGDRSCLMESELEYAALLQHENKNEQAAALAARLVGDAETMGYTPGIAPAKNILARAALTRNDVERARQYAMEALANDSAASEIPVALALLETVALCAAARGQFAIAATLASAAHAQREKYGLPLAPVEHAEATALRNHLRAALGENFLPHWETGRALTLEEARIFVWDV